MLNLSPLTRILRGVLYVLSIELYLNGFHSLSLAWVVPKFFQKNRLLIISLITIFFNNSAKSIVIALFKVNSQGTILHCFLASNSRIFYIWTCVCKKITKYFPNSTFVVNSYKYKKAFLLKFLIKI